MNIPQIAYLPWTLDLELVESRVAQEASLDSGSLQVSLFALLHEIVVGDLVASFAWKPSFFLEYIGVPSCLLASEPALLYQKAGPFVLNVFVGFLGQWFRHELSKILHKNWSIL